MSKPSKPGINLWTPGNTPRNDESKPVELMTANAMAALFGKEKKEKSPRPGYQAPTTTNKVPKSSMDISTQLAQAFGNTRAQGDSAMLVGGNKGYSSSRVDDRLPTADSRINKAMGVAAAGALSARGNAATTSVALEIKMQQEGFKDWENCHTLKQVLLKLVINHTDILPNLGSVQAGGVGGISFGGDRSGIQEYVVFINPKDDKNLEVGISNLRPDENREEGIKRIITEIHEHALSTNKVFPEEAAKRLGEILGESASAVFSEPKMESVESTANLRQAGESDLVLDNNHIQSPIMKAAPTKSNVGLGRSSSVKQMDSVQQQPIANFTLLPDETEMSDLTYGYPGEAPFSSHGNTKHKQVNVAPSFEITSDNEGDEKNLGKVAVAKADVTTTLSPRAGASARLSPDKANIKKVTDLVLENSQYFFRFEGTGNKKRQVKAEWKTEQVGQNHAYEAINGECFDFELPKDKLRKYRIELKKNEQKEYYYEMQIDERIRYPNGALSDAYKGKPRPLAKLSDDEVKVFEDFVKEAQPKKISPVNNIDTTVVKPTPPETVESLANRMKQLAVQPGFLGGDKKIQKNSRSKLFSAIAVKNLKCLDNVENKEGSLGFDLNGESYRIVIADDESGLKLYKKTAEDVAVLLNLDKDGFTKLLDVLKNRRANYQEYDDDLKKPGILKVVAATNAASVSVPVASSDVVTTLASTQRPHTATNMTPSTSSAMLSSGALGKTTSTTAGPRIDLIKHLITPDHLAVINSPEVQNTVQQMAASASRSRLGQSNSTTQMQNSASRSGLLSASNSRPNNFNVIQSTPFSTPAKSLAAVPTFTIPPLSSDQAKSLMAAKSAPTNLAATNVTPPSVNSENVANIASLAASIASDIKVASIESALSKPPVTPTPAASAVPSSESLFLQDTKKDKVKNVAEQMGRLAKSDDRNQLFITVAVKNAAHLHDASAADNLLGFKLGQKSYRIKEDGKQLKIYEKEGKVESKPSDISSKNIEDLLTALNEQTKGVFEYKDYSKDFAKQEVNVWLKDYTPSTSVQPRAISNLAMFNPVAISSDAWQDHDRGNKFRYDGVYKGKDLGATQKNLEDAFLNILILAATRSGNDHTRALSEADTLSHDEIMRVLEISKKGGITNTVLKDNEGNATKAFDDKNQQDEKFKKFSRRFQKLCEEYGIYSGEKDIDQKLGLRLTYLPESVRKRVESEEGFKNAVEDNMADYLTPNEELVGKALENMDKIKNGLTDKITATTSVNKPERMVRRGSSDSIASNNSDRRR